MKKTSSFITLLFLAACATSGNPAIKDAEMLSKIEKNVTTQQDVLQMYGEPQVKKKALDGKETWGYAYTEAKLKGATFIPIVGIFAGGAKADVNSIEFEFDEGGVLRKYSLGEGNIETQNFGETKTKIDTVEQ